MKIEKKNLARNGQGSEEFATQSCVMWAHQGSNLGPLDYKSENIGVSKKPQESEITYISLYYR